MKAAVLTDDHRFDVADLADPTPGAGELVLRVGACGICGSDLKAYAAFPAGTVMGRWQLGQEHRGRRGLGRHGSDRACLRA